MTASMPSRTAILALTLLIAGCSGAVRQPTYYSLALAPQTDTVRDPLPHPVTVAVRQFETPAYLRQGRIVYREHPEQIGFYEYPPVGHRSWSDGHDSIRNVSPVRPFAFLCRTV